MIGLYVCVIMFIITIINFEMEIVYYGKINIKIPLNKKINSLTL